MSGLEIALIAVLGYFIYKGHKRNQVRVGTEDLGGGLSDTDIEGYMAPQTTGARVHPVVVSKPTGLEGNQTIGAQPYKSNADFTAQAMETPVGMSRPTIRAPSVAPSGDSEADPGTASGMASGG